MSKSRTLKFKSGTFSNLAFVRMYIWAMPLSPSEGKAYVQVINSSDTDRELVVPTVELEKIEQICGSKLPFPLTKKTEPSNTYSIAAISDTRDIDRVKTIQCLLKLEHLNDEESKYVTQIIEEHNDLFRIASDQLNYTNIISHKIVTDDEIPVHIKQYGFPPIHKEEVNQQIKELLENDTIKPSESPYNSPFWIVPKKPDSKCNKRSRIVINYRALNEKTIGDAYPLPNITEILDQLGSAEYFNVFDLASGFHQIPMHESHAQKTAFLSL